MDIQTTYGVAKSTIALSYIDRTKYIVLSELVDLHVSFEKEKQPGIS